MLLTTNGTNIYLMIDNSCLSTSCKRCASYL